MLTERERKVFETIVKPEAIRRGYRFEVTLDGTVKLIRPDGTVAMIARKEKKADAD